MAGHNDEIMQTRNCAVIGSRFFFFFLPTKYSNCLIFLNKIKKIKENKIEREKKLREK